MLSAVVDVHMGVQNSNIVMGNSVDECAKAASTDGQLIGSYTFFWKFVGSWYNWSGKEKRGQRG